MATQQRLAGSAFVSVEGVSYPLVGELEWTPSDVTRESLVGMDGYHGFSEKPVATHMSGTFRDTAGVPAATFRDMVNVTVVFELNSGKTVIGSNMVTTEAIVVNSVEGTMRITWVGAEVIEA